MLNSTPRDALAQATGSRLFRAIVENSSDLLLVVSAEGHLAYISPSVRTVLGFAPRDVQGVALSGLLAGPSATGLVEVFGAAAADPEQACRIEATFRHSSGHWVPCEVTVTALLHDPHVQGFVVTVRDVGERKRVESALTRQAYSDALTGLPNRVLFQARVEQALRQRSSDIGNPAGQSPGGVAVLFCDLDGFKAVNDVQGHAAGDQLLKIVATRLTECIRQFDTVARLGGPGPPRRPPPPKDRRAPPARVHPPVRHGGPARRRRVRRPADRPGGRADRRRDRRTDRRVRRRADPVARPVRPRRDQHRP